MELASPQVNAPHWEEQRRGHVRQGQFGIIAANLEAIQELTCAARSVWDNCGKVRSDSRTDISG